jgi:hypothetical protein
VDGTGGILLRRRGLVAPPLPAAGPVPSPEGRLPRRLGMVRADVPSGVRALEAELLQLGHLVSAELRDALAGLTADELTRAGRRLLHVIRAELGASAEHVPLFRRFPHSVPADTERFYVRRVFALLLQEPEQPCVLCGETGVVHPVSPCAHLVCRSCWDGSDFSACPICHRRIDPADPFLKPSGKPPARARRTVRAVSLLRLCPDPLEAARELAVSMLARRTPMPPRDRADLVTLLEECWPGSREWLAEPIPVKETRAVALAVAVRRGAGDLLPRHLDTATDVLRLLYVLMDGDPGLRIPPARRRSLPRAVRRAVLACLDGMPYLVEDLLRYREPWKRMAEVLHPHEYWQRYPSAAVAFAALRGTPLFTGAPFGRAMVERAADHPDLMVMNGWVRPVTFASRVEAALADKDGERALALLAHRPGELARRLSHLLRLAPDPVTSTGEAVLGTAVRRVAPGVLMAALGQVRTPPGKLRLFLPRGGTARIRTRPDDRPAPPDEAVLKAERILAGELLRRAARLPALRAVLLDEGLADLVAPTSERTASAALVRLARGSVQPIPRGDHLRFFLHWAQPEGTRVDLDLSVALFDDGWRFAGLCDYTHLRFGTAVVHSGDLTSAPEPLGASEFVDVRVASLRARYLVPVVFSYNDVPFESLVRGFAGFMRRPEGVFDPLAVRQRFDLAGPAKILVPLVADLWTRTMRWADINLSAAGYGHNIARYAPDLALVGKALEQAFEHRVTLWEVACLHAAGRAGRVLVRRRDGSLVRYEREAGEDLAAFAARVTARAGAPPYTGSLDEVELAALVRGDVELPAGARAYALYPGGLGEGVARLDAADLVAGLGPDG